GLAGDWMLSMWNDLVFDRTGNLYVPDDKPRVWRVSPDGTARIWFTDPRLLGLFGFAGGPLGGRIDPAARRVPRRRDDLPDPPRRPPDGGRHGAGPPVRRVARPDRTGPAGDRPRLRQVRQPLRQSARPE